MSVERLRLSEEPGPKGEEMGGNLHVILPSRVSILNNAHFRVRTIPQIKVLDPNDGMFRMYELDLRRISRERLFRAMSDRVSRPSKTTKRTGLATMRCAWEGGHCDEPEDPQSQTGRRRSSGQVTSAHLPREA